MAKTETTRSTEMIVGEVLARMPEWARVDLSSKEPAARVRAEETVAAMIVAALAR